MFEAIFLKGDLFKKIIEAVKELCKDVNFECSEEGMTIQAMDGSHVALVALKLDASNDEGSPFETYRCDRSMSIGVNMESLAKIFRLCGNDDRVKMVVEEEAPAEGEEQSETKPSKCQFTFEDTARDKTSDFTMKLIDIESEHLGIPDQAYSCAVQMPSAEFAKMVKELQVFGDTVQVTVNKEEAKFSINGDIGDGFVTLKPRTTKEDKENIILTVEDPIEQSFALRYLSLFSKAAPLSSSMSLSLSDAHPMVVSFPLEKDEFGNIKYFLAPKIDE